MADDIQSILMRLAPQIGFFGDNWGPPDLRDKAPPLTVRSPVDGNVLAEVPQATPEQVDYVIGTATHRFPAWRDTPAPARGEIVRKIGNAFREHESDLATLVAWEAGKILP